MLKRVMFLAVVLIAFLCELSVNLRRAQAQGSDVVHILKVREDTVKVGGDLIGFFCAGSDVLVGCHVMTH